MSENAPPPFLFQNAPEAAARYCKKSLFEKQKGFEPAPFSRSLTEGYEVPEARRVAEWRGK